MKHQPSVYGPVATGIQALAALIGGANPAVTVWALMILNGAVFLGVGWLLLRTSDDPVRATLCWAANPVLLQQLVAGGHLDTFVAAAASCAIQVARRVPGPARDCLAAVLLGLACGIKANAVLIAVGLAWPLLWRREWLRLTRMAAVVAATLAAAYAPFGLCAFRPLLGGLQLVTIVSPWRLFRLAGHALGISDTAVVAVTSLLWPVAMLLIAWLVSQRIAASQPREVVTPFALTFAWIIAAPWALPWYTAPAWATLTQVPRNRMTRWLAIVTTMFALYLSRGGQAPPIQS